MFCSAKFRSTTLLNSSQHCSNEGCIINAQKYLQSNKILKLKKRNRQLGVCCTERQSSTYPVSICFLGTPSIVSPWPWLTLNFCPNEPLHNITQSKAIKLLDAIWSPFVVLNNNQALYVMHSSRKLCRVYETPRQLTASVA